MAARTTREGTITHQRLRGSFNKAGRLLKKDGTSFTFATRFEGNWEDCGLDAMVFLFLHYQN
jgi:hypothetical protein